MQDAFSTVSRIYLRFSLYHDYQLMVWVDLSADIRVISGEVNLRHVIFYYTSSAFIAII